MVRRSYLLALAGACLAALVGCGSTTVRHVTKTITAAATTPTATTSTSTPTATTSTATTTHGAATATTHSAAPGRAHHAGGHSSRGPAAVAAGTRPAAMIADAARALRHAGGYAMNAHLVQGKQRIVVTLTASAANAFDATLTAGRVTSEVISVSGEAFLRANAAFWRTHNGGSAAAGRLANHWLRVPAGDATKSLGSLAPNAIARCLTEDHGRLSRAGHTTVGGRRALVIRDAGNAPGATPGTIDVAATGRPYPLLYTATGRSRPGGRIDVCNDGKGSDAEGTIRFDQFGAVAPVQPPENADQDPNAAHD